MTLTEYAQRELDLLDATNDRISPSLRDMIYHLISEVETMQEDDSNITSEHAINILIRLMRKMPLTPLTGNDDEWQPSPLERCSIKENKRYPLVFKLGESNDTSYCTKAIVHSRDGGKTYHSYFTKCSENNLEFPYYPSTTPTKVIINIDPDGSYTDDKRISNDWKEGSLQIK